MIVYEPNKNWLGDIMNLSKSWTMKKIVFAVVLIGIYSSLVVFLAQYFNYDPKLHTGIFSLLGVLLSILLVFRTNSAYDRWWEGRKQWGALVNNTRNYAVYLNAMLPKADKDTRKYFCIWISNFCIAFKEHLRKGTKVEELISITEEDKEDLETKAHIPNYIAFKLYDKLQVIYKSGTFTDADMINIKPQHQSLLDILGACERIKKTPIPFSYAVYIKIFVTMYGILLPFGLVTDFGWYTVPLVMFIFFAMIGLELMAEEIEEPFGLDCNDLPTGDIAHTIKNNVFEILEVDDRKKEPLERELYEKIH